MDAAYDSQKAGEIHISVFLKFDKPLSHFIADQLEVVALKRLNSPHSGIQISHIASVTTSYEVIQTKNVWRLVHRVTASVKHAALSDVFDCLWKDDNTKKDIKTQRQSNFGKLGPLYFPKTFRNF